MIVLTGGTGFIGTRLAPRLADAYGAERIVCFSRDVDSPFEAYGRGVLDHAGLRCVRGDLLSGAGLDRLPRSPSLLIHLGASTETREPDHRCNDVGTQRLLEAVGPLGPESHVIYSSSMAVTDHRADYTRPLTEEDPDPRRPWNEYGRSKLRAETWLKAQSRAHGFRLTILRLSTVYGARPRLRGMFDSLRQLALEGSWIARINWPGRTGLVYVDDVASAIIGLAQAPPPPGQPETLLVYAECPTFGQVCEWIHEGLGVVYRPIVLPGAFWATCSWLARRCGLWERVLPRLLYNPVWRASLIIDHVLWADSDTLARRLPEWRPAMFKEKAAEVVSACSLASE